MKISQLCPWEFSPIKTTLINSSLNNYTPFLNWNRLIYCSDKLIHLFDKYYTCKTFVNVGTTFLHDCTYWHRNKILIGTL